ncbi:HNH endonuclease [Tessaracoccus sp. SD287]|uniref:HNH endonuclease family protein n=1 Tax=Tessaracoccus sp. SD287 TaxID=2782008 RepID=UPI001A95C2A6|nr:HNH endonuclease family protein [Tessaracoccus sp. SD287]MBO1031688.1 HNH endonuclease [Tessaracoccus sp. SD287]
MAERNGQAWWQGRWLLGIAAGVIGLGVGAAAIAGPAAVPAPQVLETVSGEVTSTQKRTAASTTVAPTVLVPATQTQPRPVDGGSALAGLRSLPVKGRAPKTGYDRAQFGQRWYDLDRNGCDTRNDILRRDLQDVELKPGTRDCVVLSGMLQDPYTGTQIPFVRGNATSSAVQIDHVVSLSDAWQKGAQQLAPERRQAFANDPLNLLAVDGSSNASKGDGDAATWLPRNKGYRCAYVARQVAVKVKYSLWVTEAEQAAGERVLVACPSEPLPSD